MRKIPLFLLLLLPAVAIAGGRVSNWEKKGKLGVNYWSSGSAMDGKLDTAWMVPGESPNRGEWIEVDIPQGDVDKIAIYPGFGKSDDTFHDYPRIKQVRVDIFALDDDQNAQQVGSSTVNVEDKAGLQIIDVPDAKVAAGLFGGRVRFSVIDIYEGEDYPNIAISEVAVVMKEFDAKVQVDQINDQLADPALTDPAFDGNPKTIAKFTGPTTFTMSSPTYGLSSIGFVAGGKDMARPKTVEISFPMGMTTTTVLADKPDAQWAPIPAFNGFTGGYSGPITVKIVDTYPGTKSQDLGINEIKAKATNLQQL